MSISVGSVRKKGTETTVTRCGGRRYRVAPARRLWLCGKEEGGHGSEGCSEDQMSDQGLGTDGIGTGRRWAEGAVGSWAGRVQKWKRVESRHGLGGSQPDDVHVGGCCTCEGAKLQFLAIDSPTGQTWRSSAGAVPPAAKPRRDGDRLAQSKACCVQLTKKNKRSLCLACPSCLHGMRPRGGKRPRTLPVWTKPSWKGA